MTPKGCLLNALLCLTCMALIYFGGMFVLRMVDKHDISKIEQHGTSCAPPSQSFLTFSPSAGRKPLYTT